MRVLSKLSRFTLGQLFLRTLADRHDRVNTEQHDLLDEQLEQHKKQVRLGYCSTWML